MDSVVLNKEQKLLLRKLIEELLEQLPKGKKININPTILTQLIFDFKIKNCKVVSYPVWTGEFLRKIDLSNVLFYNVDWDLSNLDEEYSDKIIDFSYTNANIDFSKTLQELVNCDFSHMDLSQSNCSCIRKAINSNFSYSQALFDFNTETLINRNTRFQNCVFEGIDLTNSYINSEYINTHLCTNDFSNTGLTIIHTNGIDISYDNLYSGIFEGCYFYERKVIDEIKASRQKILI